MPNQENVSSDSLDKKPKSLKGTFNKEAEKPVSAGEILPPDQRRVRLKGKRFVITSAQNNTDVHPGFLKALETYCEENDAQLLISKFVYNKNAYQQDEETGELWYDPKIKK